MGLFLAVDGVRNQGDASIGKTDHGASEVMTSRATRHVRTQAEVGQRGPTGSCCGPDFRSRRLARDVVAGQLKTGTTLAAATNRAEAGARAVETQAADGWEVNGD